MVYVLATGGTIAGKSTHEGYKSGSLGVDELIRKFGISDLCFEQFSNIGSQDMNDAIWLNLAKRVQEILELDEISAVVILHGTDTMESAAYFLHLAITSQKPVILTGSMIPGDSQNTDALRNLQDAISVAKSQKTIGFGTVVVFNSQIYAAREICKTQTNLVNAFSSLNSGPLGMVINSNVEILMKPTKAKGLLENLPLNLPKTTIILANEGAVFNEILDFDGVVLIGFGNGNFNQKQVEFINKNSQNKVFVISSRVQSGFVQSVETKLKNVIWAGSLSAWKARVLLTLALSKTKNLDEIRDIFKNF